MSMDKGKVMATVLKGVVMVAANAAGLLLTTMFQTKPEQQTVTEAVVDPPYEDVTPTEGETTESAE